ncbi:hypothetical protein [Anaerovorax odorimutans]|uniref:hypothetical protein n=1 Tax=Anaerovorax odorimutans TaxID=109327 RepID=UPI000402269A|nr:hypothetical protein [Anaerovorax odorimutans]
MYKYYKLIMIPAIIVIVGVVFSGFSVQTHEKTVSDLLEERTSVLQNAYYCNMDKEKVVKLLKKIETYPLLSKDIDALQSIEDGCQIDVVKSMDIKTIERNVKMFNFISFDVDIDWSMSGLSGDYLTDGQYSVVIKSEGRNYKLSEFNLE